MQLLLFFMLRKKIDLAFILAEVDWVVTTPCPTETGAGEGDKRG